MYVYIYVFNIYQNIYYDTTYMKTYTVIQHVSKQYIYMPEDIL